MITKSLIDKIEGEATIYFDTEDDKVVSSSIAFGEFRGIENILKGKNAKDALVITPRVCGICGHAHLFATVRAIEDAYKNSGIDIKLSQKVKSLRELTLIMEMIQNHFKWVYFTILPSLSRLKKESIKQTQLKGAFASNLTSKIIAIFGGQWPHSSYMVPSGITSDPTYLDIIQAQGYLDQLVSFFEKESLGISLDRFLGFESCKDFRDMNSDISNIEKSLVELKMHEKGFAYDRFLVLGEHSFTNKAKLHQTRALNVDERYVTLKDGYSPHKISFAKNALYKERYYETGSLARLISTNKHIVKNMHRRFKDSAYSRVMARIFEIGYLLDDAKKILNSIDILEPSFKKIEDITTITSIGIGVVEAPRGPLIHKIDIENGIIKDYNMITPTQFNIGSDKKQTPTPAQKSMLGLSIEEASFVFKSFDVCSVCTTH